MVAQVELWRNVIGFPGYQVSDLGRARSIDRTITTKRGVKKNLRGKILAMTPDNHGYPKIYVGVVSNKPRHVHKLVAAAFIPQDKEHPLRNQINHKNSVRSDNRVLNLEWVTSGENTKHGYLMGRKPSMLGQTGAAHPFSRPVVATFPDGSTRWFAAAKDAGRNGYSTSAVCKACNGILRTHRGAYWKYV